MIPKEKAQEWANNFRSASKIHDVYGHGIWLEATDDTDFYSSLARALKGSENGILLTCDELAYIIELKWIHEAF